MRIARGISVTNTSKPVGISYDADAAAFFTAASITDTTQKSAVNTLVLSLKSANIWTKMKALYPVVGGVASAHAINLKTPGTYNLSFATGWTHSSTGMTPLNTYANTFVNLNSTQTSSPSHLSYYSRTFENSGSGEIGSSDGSTNANTMYMSYLGTAYCYNGLSKNVTVTGQTNQTKGFYLANANANSLKLFKNNSQLGNTTTLTSYVTTNLNIYLGAININNVASLFSNKQCAFASIGDGLTDAEATNFYTAVQNYQTTLGRQV